MTHTPGGAAGASERVDGHAFYLVCCTTVIVNEVEQGLSQKAIALTYAMALRSAAVGVDAPDWSVINGAILRRWNHGALDRIKTRAWGIAEGRIKP